MARAVLDSCTIQGMEVREDWHSDQAQCHTVKLRSLLSKARMCPNFTGSAGAGAAVIDRHIH